MKALLTFPLVLTLAVGHSPAIGKESAEDIEDLRARTLALIQNLGKKGVLPPEKVDSLATASQSPMSRRPRSELRAAEVSAKPVPVEPKTVAVVAEPAVPVAEMSASASPTPISAAPVPAEPVPPAQEMSVPVAQLAPSAAPVVAEPKQVERVADPLPPAQEIPVPAPQMAQSAAPVAVEATPAVLVAQAPVPALPVAEPAAPLPLAPREIQVMPPETREELEALRQMSITLTQALVQSGILTQEKADAMLRDAKRRAASGTEQGAGSKVVRIPYVPQLVRNEIKEELRHEVMAEAKAGGWAAPGKLPAWLEGTRFESDIRLRFQHDQFPKGNFSPLQLGFMEDPISVNNSQEANNRWRLRLRFGLESALSEMTTIGLRLATGNLSDPLSTNQTMGSSFNRYTLGVDKAYLRLQPWHWLTLNGGRFGNPFFGTDLVWHPDLNFDGVAAAVRTPVYDRVSGFATVGAFPLQKIDPNSASGTAMKAKSKWLFGVQVGADGSFGNHQVKLGAGLYDYQHVEGIANSGILGSQEASLYNQTVPQWRQKGNSLFDINNAVIGSTASYALAAKFRELNITGSWDYARWDPFHVVVTADWVKNLGFDRNEILQRSGYRDIEPRTLGYLARLSVGMPQVAKRGDWQAFLTYKYLERDAVLDAYTDSDFRLGGTDAKGYILGGSYGIDKNTWLGLKWTSADAIDGPVFSVDSLFLDLNARF